MNEYGEGVFANLKTPIIGNDGDDKDTNSGESATGDDADIWSHDEGD